MTALTPPPRCEPPPELRGVDGWHWVAMYSYERPLWWSGDHDTPAWIVPGGGRVSPETASRHGYRYIAPAATPAEVEALRAERHDWERKATEIAVDFGDQYAKASDLRARVAVLEAVVERLGSSEAFVLAGPIGPELRARITYARAVLENNP